MRLREDGEGLKVRGREGSRPIRPSSLSRENIHEVQKENLSHSCAENWAFMGKSRHLWSMKLVEFLAFSNYTPPKHPVSNLPMDDVGEEVVVLEPVVDADLLVVDGQRPRVDATLLQRQITI